jgi:hypothetical protein
MESVMMPEITSPQYPVYIPSKGRPNSQTARRLIKDGVPFHIVVQPQDREAYVAIYGEERVLVLPFTDHTHGLMRARNWIKEHATSTGHKRHWQLDDNIQVFYRYTDGRRLPCLAGIALRICEELSDRYENVAISGLNYAMFVNRSHKQPPFYLNVHVYSCTLVLNAIPHCWRIRYNDDTDICLQVLADRWCTILLNAFVAQKLRTMTVKGGNTDDLYKITDGRLKMAKQLERLWPGIVKTKRRFGRPQHVIRKAWGNFDTPLKRRSDIDFNALPQIDEHGLRLTAVRDIHSEALRKYVANRNQEAFQPAS